MHRPNPAIVIAAGGEGTRIGGNKPGQGLAGRSLLDHALAWARAHSDEIAIAVRAKDQVAEPCANILLDKFANIGPISALDSAFRFAQQRGRDTVILICCDQPFLPANLATRLEQDIAHGQLRNAGQQGARSPDGRTLAGELRGADRLH